MVFLITDGIDLCARVAVEPMYSADDLGTIAVARRFDPGALPA